MAEPVAPAECLSDDGRILTLRFPASVAQLPWAQARLTAFLRGCRQPDRTVGRAELLLEELVTNVINHGALGDPATAMLSLAAEIEPDSACRLVFEDPGRAFDPVAAPLPGRPKRLEEARVGGLGLVLLQRMARDLDYVRLPEGRNRLSLRLGGGRA